MAHRSAVRRPVAVVALAAALGCTVPGGTRPDRSELRSSDEVPAETRFDRFLAAHIDRVPSLAVAVVTPEGPSYVKAFGVADRATGRRATTETMYGIGSVTKPLTASILLALRDEGKLTLDRTISSIFPAGTTLPHEIGALRLDTLASHAAALPRLPVNLSGVPGDPYNGFTCEKLVEGLAVTDTAAPAQTTVFYSNLGYALLAHALERATGSDYATLLKQKVSDPLGLRATRYWHRLEEPRETALPYRGDEVATFWNLGCLGGSGAVMASIADLAVIVQAQLVDARFAELHRPRRLNGTTRSSGAVGLGWLVDDLATGGEMVWHNGGRDGYSAFVGFDPRAKVGVALLTNDSRDAFDLDGDGVSEEDLTQLGRYLLEEATRIVGAKPQGPRLLDAAVPPSATPVVGERFRQTTARFLATLDGGPSETVVEELFTPGFIEALGGLRAFTSAVRELADEVGPCQLESATAPAPFEVAFGAACRGGRLTGTMTLDGRLPTPRIDGISLDPAQR